MRDDNHLEARAERKAYAAMQTDPAVELFENLIAAYEHFHPGEERPRHADGSIDIVAYVERMVDWMAAGGGAQEVEQVRAAAEAYVRTIAHHRRHWGNGYGAELFEL
jgi:hypothetical protein